MTEAKRRAQGRNLSTFFSAGALLGSLTLGCSVTGTWRTTAVAPPDATFPITLVTFNDHKQFTATREEHGRRRTSTGTFTGSAGRLRLVVADNPQLALTGRRCADGKLELVQSNGQQVKATLERVKE